MRCPSTRSAAAATAAVASSRSSVLRKRSCSSSLPSAAISSRCRFTAAISSATGRPPNKVRSRFIYRLRRRPPLLLSRAVVEQELPFGALQFERSGSAALALTDEFERIPTRRPRDLRQRGKDGMLVHLPEPVAGIAGIRL